MTPQRDSESGSITAFVTVMAMALVMVAGMAYDGGQVIATQAAARSDADKAARAGAQQIDITHLRSTGETILDSRKAAAAALGFLQEADAAGTAVVQGATITVTVTITQPMLILPVPDRLIVVSGTATALDGPPQ